MHTRVLLIAGLCIALLMLFLGGPELLAVKYDSTQLATVATKSSSALLGVKSETEGTSAPADTRLTVTHVPLPIPTKTIYMTSCVAGTKTFRDKLIAFADQTDINSIIIDIKDYSGTISFPPEHESWKAAWQKAGCGAPDMKGLVASLHAKGIYVIGRITVFQDPFYVALHPELAVKRADGVTVWKDRKGLAFIDVGAKPYWDHLIELATDAYNIGFDELNFDYVRYPSDGNMQDISFPNSYATEYGKDKQANLEAFFKYLNGALDNPELFSVYSHINTGRTTSTPYMSVDLFGMTTSNTDDLAIGQILERTAPYFDFIAPMVYPSHYPKGFIGLADPNDYPYKVVNYAMQQGANRMVATTTKVNGFFHERIGTSTPALYKKPQYPASKLRTWIQDFDYGGDYDATDVRNQIQASIDAGVVSYMVWAPSNIYTRDAFNAP